MDNNRIKILSTKTLSDNWYVLNKVTYDYQKKSGDWETHTREAYDRGNGATILLYNKAKRNSDPAISDAHIREWQQLRHAD